MSRTLFACRPEIGLNDLATLFLTFSCSFPFFYFYYLKLKTSLGLNLLKMSNIDSIRSSWSNAASSTDFLSIPNYEMISPPFKSEINDETSNITSLPTWPNWYFLFMKRFLLTCSPPFRNTDSSCYPWSPVRNTNVLLSKSLKSSTSSPMWWS